AGRIQARRGTVPPAAASASSSSPRVGGLSRYSETPASTNPPPTTASATVVEITVARNTPNAGATMYDTSTDIESIEYAGRRSAAGTSAARDCRMTVNTGSDSTPARNDATSSTRYGCTGTVRQNNASTTFMIAISERITRRTNRQP